ncbi:competence type IV pilus major pilin ComGC [Oceanobacillus halotolerans]|uniref:competence type IV pilus major pilin ComGC n=1 Tax=Oceanobacillus halotolerans TaxID=2663380 RepID=UPI0013DA21B9|nr:competence type IV pilus major pilin ComGC [Oceanobacillus halotolerans]
MFQSEKGFTLIEMLVVLMIISVLILLIIPNLGEKSESVNEQGCDALVSVVQAQADAYYLEEGNYPTDLATLEGDNYITEDQKTCPDGSTILINSGTVSVSTD